MRSALTAAALATSAITVTATAAALASPASAAPGSAPHVARASGRAQHVIVLLDDQHTNLPLQRSSASRQAAVHRDQSPLRTEIRELGGRTTRAFSVVNAIAATVPAGGVAALRANPGVRAVVPDLPIAMARPSVERVNPDAPSGRVPRSTYCPTSPDSPQLEPEALELTHTDSDQGGPTARSLGYTGAGVKVAFIADGTDVDQPDLIRADGSHVVTDYQDFSGDGTTSATSGAEAMGDVGSIAAQGRASYDISRFVNNSHPLPRGCTIRIEGMAPGASVVALKVFPNALLTAPTSTLVQAIDYAVTVDHVNVINESFGSNPYPDNATDPVSIANQEAIDSGVTVTSSTGDSGTGNTLGSASTDPNVIAAAGSTSERVYAQTGTYGFGLSNGRYTSDNVSGLSSGGVSQTNRVPDLLAPGDLNWSLCSDALLPDGTPQYLGCASYRGLPSPIQVFGGTSQSAPLTAGAAALVIQAYRRGHAGASPTPAVVRTILDSTADDLGMPAEQQGAGLLDTYRAVQLAHDYRTGSGSGQELSTSVPQLSNVADAGTRVTNTVTVTNDGAGPQRLTAAVRQVNHLRSRQIQQVPFDPATAPTFLDRVGNVRPYTKATITVPVGVDRMDVAVSVAGDGTKYLRATVLDPNGTYTAYTLPQGTGNYAHIGVRQPGPGKWTVIIWSLDATTSVQGPVTLRASYFTATRAGSVSPAAATIPAGASRRFRVTTTVPAAQADAPLLVLTHRFGRTTSVPIVDRAVQRVGAGSPARFSGQFDQANGRDFSPAQSFTYLVDVPAGAKDLDVDVAVAGRPSNQILANLSGPDGEPVAIGRNDLPGTDTAAGPSYPGLQLVHAEPQPGRYQLTLELANQSSGAALPVAFHGAFVLNGAQVSAALPAGATLGAGGVTRTVTIANTSPTPQTYFLDPRGTNQATYSLVASDIVGDAPDPNAPYRRTVTVPLPSDDVIPAWLVPTQMRRLTVGSSATDPIAFDLMPLDNPTALNAPNNPDVEATVSGRSASATHTAAEVGSAQWIGTPAPFGTVPAGGTPKTTVTMSAQVTGRSFDRSVTSSTGDPLLASVDYRAAGTTPVTVQPGRSVTVTVHFGGAAGRHAGTLFVDIAQPFGPLGGSTLTEEVAALPYAYLVRD